MTSKRAPSRMSLEFDDKGGAAAKPNGKSYRDEGKPTYGRKPADIEDDKNLGYGPKKQHVLTQQAINADAAEQISDARNDLS